MYVSIRTAYASIRIEELTLKLEGKEFMLYRVECCLPYPLYWLRSISLGRSLNKLALSQRQIVEYRKKYPEWASHGVTVFLYDILKDEESEYAGYSLVTSFLYYHFTFSDYFLESKKLRKDMPIGLPRNKENVFLLVPK